METDSIKAEIFKRVDALAEKVGVVGADLWMKYVFGMRVEAGVWTVVQLGVALAIATFTVKLYKRTQEENYDEFVYLPISILGGAAVIFFLLSGSNLAIFIAPEYFAIKSIIGH